MARHMPGVMSDKKSGRRAPERAHGQELRSEQQARALARRADPLNAGGTPREATEKRGPECSGKEGDGERDEIFERRRLDHRHPVKPKR